MHKLGIKPVSLQCTTHYKPSLLRKELHTQSTRQPMIVPRGGAISWITQGIVLGAGVPGLIPRSGASFSFLLFRFESSHLKRWILHETQGCNHKLTNAHSAWVKDSADQFQTGCIRRWNDKVFPVTVDLILIILFYMNSLNKTRRLCYIKVHEEEMHKSRTLGE